MAPRDEGGKVVEELITLNLKHQHLLEDIKEYRIESAEQIKIVYCELQKLADLITGGDDTDRGIIIRVDRVREALHQLEQRTSLAAKTMSREIADINVLLKGDKSDAESGLILNMSHMQGFVKTHRRVMWIIVSAVLGGLCTWFIKWLVTR